MNYIKNVLPLSFTVMVLLWVIDIFTFVVSGTFVSALVWIVIIFHTFVLSIIHLAKYKERKLFTIISLVISGMLTLTALVGFGIGIGMVIQN